MLHPLSRRTNSSPSTGREHYAKRVTQTKNCKSAWQRILLCQHWITRGNQHRDMLSEVDFERRSDEKHQPTDSNPRYNDHWFKKTNVRLTSHIGLACWIVRGLTYQDTLINKDFERRPHEKHQWTDGNPRNCDPWSQRLCHIKHDYCWTRHPKSPWRAEDAFTENQKERIHVDVSIIHHNLGEPVKGQLAEK